MKVVLGIALLTLSLASTMAFGFTFDNNVPDNIKKQMLTDLDFMKSIQGNGASPLHQKVYGQVDGSAYDHFIQSRVKAVGLNSCGSPNAVACVNPVMGHSKMWLTQNFIKFSHPQVARMMVVYHEARHTEIAHRFWSHAKCPTPFLGPDGQDMKSIWTGAKLAGQPACDKTPIGSYGSSAIMLKNISKLCTNCTDKVKEDAGIYADDQLKRITDAKARQEMVDDIFK